MQLEFSHIALHLSCLALHKIVSSWNMTVNFHKFNQVVIPTTAVVPDVIAWFEQINTSPGTECKLLIWRMLFSSYLLVQTTRSCFRMGNEQYTFAVLPQGYTTAINLCS